MHLYAVRIFYVWYEFFKYLLIPMNRQFLVLVYCFYGSVKALERIDRESVLPAINIVMQHIEKNAFVVVIQWDNMQIHYCSSGVGRRSILVSLEKAKLMQESCRSCFVQGFVWACSWQCASLLATFLDGKVSAVQLVTQLRIISFLWFLIWWWINLPPVGKLICS